MKKQIRTAPAPHKIARYASLFLAPLEKKDNPELGLGWFWQGDISANDGKQFGLTIEAKFKLTARHGQMFDYVLSRSTASKSKTVSFNIEEFLKESDKDISWNSKKNAMKTLTELTGFALSLKSGGGFSSWRAIVIAVDADKKTGKCSITFGEDLDKMFNVAGVRYVSLEDGLKLKGKTPEFLKFLQLNGRGIHKGKVHYRKEFTFAEAKQYLHIPDEKGVANIANEIKREVKKVEHVVGVKYKKDGYLWRQIYEL